MKKNTATKTHDAPPPSDTTTEYTADTLFEGRMRIKQKKSGYRFSIDSVLLAHFELPHSGEAILDLGTGCGVMPLILSSRVSGISITGVEIQPSLAILAQENASLNCSQNPVEIVNADMQEFAQSYHDRPFDRIISNPPYTRKDAGRINPNSERAIARHEISIDLDGVIMTAEKLLRDQGRFTIVYPFSRYEELISVMERRGLPPVRIRMVYPRRGDKAIRVLVCSEKNGTSRPIIEKPLYIYDTAGEYTPEVSQMFV